MTAADPSLAAVRALRRTRQRRRLGDIEWFDAAYRVYMIALFGGGTVLWISSSVKDGELSAASAADVAQHAPTLLGLVAALALLVGLRGGAHGGPIALEEPDVVHVMLSPVDRRRALLRPASQRVRSALFAGALAGALAGQLAGRRLPGTLPAWALGGALFGATCAALWVGGALVAHTLRLPGWAATSIGLALLGWQTAAALTDTHGPATTTGSLGLWGWRQEAIDLVPVAIAVAMLVVGLALLERISLEALAQRSALVAQLRFAVTMQDLRTVVLLRRQLNQERARRLPWRRLAPSSERSLTTVVWRRGWHGLLRFPGTRLARLAALAAGIGVLQAMAAEGTTPAVLGSGLLAFVLGLEVMEPLSQEVDRPDHSDSMPVERGEVMVRHLAAPAVTLVPLALVAAAAAVVTAGTTDAIAPAAILAVPVLFGGVAGSVLSIVRDAPDPATNSEAQAFMPPEMAGLHTLLRMVWPVLVSTLGTCTVLLVQRAAENGTSLPGAALRGAVGSALLATIVAYWTKVRDPVLASYRNFMAQGRAQTAAQRSSKGAT